MRRFMLLSALVATVALVAGLWTVGNVYAGAPADHTLPPDDVFDDINPCTGEVTTITQSYKTAVVHFTDDASGGGHFTFTGTGTITTADGFSGRFTVWPGANGGSGGSNLEEETFTFSATLRGPGGQVANVHFVGHVTVKNGEPVVVIDREIFECVGKPA